MFARPNRKYFGPNRGVTWLNAINDQAAGLGAKVVSGTARDSLHLLDVLFSQEGGPRPEIVVVDAASYSDLVFGLMQLLGMSYRPVLADLPDQRLWRASPNADYGALNTAARGRIDKSLHMLTYLDDETYRRDLKGIRNLQEGRHDLARKIFHGKKGELHQRYEAGMEDQLGALGLVLNCVVLWNTTYQNAALDALRAQGHPIDPADVARLSAFTRSHLNVLGKYSFALPDLPVGGMRELRDPDAPGDEDD